MKFLLKSTKGSCRQLVNYMEHEDMERIEQGLFAEGFFNLTDDGIYKSDVIQRIDSNIGQLMKTGAKFYAIHVSPSAKELAQMGKTEQEQSNKIKISPLTSYHNTKNGVIKGGFDHTTLFENAEKGVRRFLPFRIQKE